MAQIGNKLNCQLNGNWGKHTKKGEKRITSKKRRKQDARIIKDELNGKGRKEIHDNS